MGHGKHSGLRSRRWFCVGYGERKDFDRILAECVHYALICHDMDVVPETGEIKESHWHLLLVYENARTLNGIKRGWLSEQNFFGEPVRGSTASCIEYLTHENEPAKHQYARDLIESDDLQSLIYCGNNNGESKALGILNDFDSRVPLREMASRYGLDFMKNAARYLEFYRMVCRQDYGGKLCYETDLRKKYLEPLTDDEYRAIIRLRAESSNKD